MAEAAATLRQLRIKRPVCRAKALRMPWNKRARQQSLSFPGP